MAKNLSATVRENLPFILSTNGAPMNKKELRDAYVSHEGCSSEFDFGQNKDTWSKLRSAIHGAAPKLVKQGVLFQPAKGKFDVVEGTAIPSAFVPFLNGQAPVAPTPVVEATPVVEDEPVVEAEPMVEVSVDNPAVIEAHIDTETQELVENVGGSRDYRKPLDQVEDGYITSSVPSSVPSSVQVSTTTLEPVVEVEEEVENAPVEPVEVEEVVEDEETQEVIEAEPVVEGEVVEAPQEPVEVQEEVEATPVEETLVEDDLDLFGEEVEEETQEEETQEEEDQQPSYDLKELRKNASFDPLSLTMKGVTGSYEVYRDMDARNIVLTQKGREDYVIVPVDVDQDRLDALNEADARYARYALKSVEIFDTAQHHKDGCTPIVKALISCIHNCEHTDDFGGLVEPCMKPLDCPLQSIWGGVAIYVNPQDA